MLASEGQVPCKHRWCGFEICLIRSVHHGLTRGAGVIPLLEIERPRVYTGLHRLLFGVKQQTDISRCCKVAYVGDGFFETRIWRQGFQQSVQSLLASTGKPVTFASAYYSMDN